MGSFLSSLFTGSNPTLSGDIGSAGNIMGFGTSVGEGDVSAASSFDQDLLGGDESKISKLLAPQISTMQKQGQQKLATTSQFGDRSGGVNASNQQTTDTTRANIDDSISRLTGDAAKDIGTLGTSTLGIGLNANQVQAGESQEQQQDIANSILGSGISAGVGALEGFATGGLSTLAPHGGGESGGVSGLSDEDLSFLSI